MHVITRRGFARLLGASALASVAGLAGCTDAAGGRAAAGSRGSAASGSASAGTAAATAAPEGTLRVGVRADVVGFGYLNERTGKYYGLEIDIARELANRLGYDEVDFVTVTPDDRKDMLLEGKVDALVACYSIAETRLKNFDFSPAYYDDAVVAVVENSSLIGSIDDLAGGVFGCMGGSNAAPLLSTKLYEMGFSDGVPTPLADDNSDVLFDTWHLLQFPSYQELSDALEEGSVDAMVLDGAIAQTYLTSDRAVLPGFTVDEVSYGVATPKGSELSGRVADAIQAMLDDGTIDAMIDTWD